MNRNKLFLILCFFCLIATNVAVASAQVSGDWNIGPGWNGPDIDTPTPIPSATPLNVVTNIWSTSLASLAMFAVVPIISSAALIMSIVLLFRSGEEVDPKIIVAGITLVIVVNIFAVVGILIINGVNSAMPIS
jgi:hypothetical protein